MKHLKYKVGDNVRVREDLKTGRGYSMAVGGNTLCAVPDMVSLAGKCVTIKEIRNGVYKVFDSEWNWTDEMFEGLDETPKLKVGQKLRIRTDLEDKYYGKRDVRCVPNMIQHGGKIVTIRKFDGVENTVFTIKEKLRGCEESWLWCIEMFDIIEEEPAPIPVPKKPNGKFNIGDRVRCTKDYDDANITNKLGRIVCEGNGHGECAVEFDEPVRFKSGDICGHDCGDKAKDNHGWWVKAELLTLEDPFEELKKSLDTMEIDVSFISNKPIVVIPVVSDSFTKAWMESFVKRNGGMAVESN